jgi:hypothetical protein
VEFGTAISTHHHLRITRLPVSPHEFVVQQQVAHLLVLQVQVQVQLVPVHLPELEQQVVHQDLLVVDLVARV